MADSFQKCIEDKEEEFLQLLGDSWCCIRCVCVCISMYLAPEIKGFPFVSYLLEARVVWGRCNFTYYQPILHPPKVTCPLERCHFKREVVIEPLFFRERLSFWRGRLTYLGKLLGFPNLNVSSILGGFPS